MEWVTDVENVLTVVQTFLVDNKGVIATVGAVLFAGAKLWSTEKAPKVVGYVQKGFDAAAKLCAGVGAICKWVADFLADLLKSDGVGGKK